MGASFFCSPRSGARREECELSCCEALGRMAAVYTGVGGE